MFKLPNNFNDAPHDGIPASWCDEGEVHNFFLLEIGYGDMECMTLKNAVYKACELLEEHKRFEMRSFPLIITPFVCDEGSCEPTGDAIIEVNSEEEFFNWVKKTFNVTGE